MHIPVESSWKPLSLPQNLLRKGSEHGLIGIEVLATDSMNDTDSSYVSSNERNDTKRKIKAVSERKATKTVIKTAPCVKSKNVWKVQTITSDSIVDNKVNEIPNRDEMNKKMKEWSDFDLPDFILYSLFSSNFLRPTEIQKETLKAVLSKGPPKDVIGAAETGSGKTLAFGIPIVSNILRNRKDKSQNINEERLESLILTPTRELAVQIKDHLKTLCKFTDISICILVGGMAVEKQIRLLSRKPDIVIGTPGRVWDLIENHSQPYLSSVLDGSLKHLVIDETDRMIENAHFQDLKILMERLNDEKEKSASRRKDVQSTDECDVEGEVPIDRQTFLFSATLSTIHKLPQYVISKRKRKVEKLKFNSQHQSLNEKLEAVISFAGIRRHSMTVIDLTKEQSTPSTLTQLMFHCDSLTCKDYLTYYFITIYPGKTIIFCNSIDCVRR